VNSRYVAFENFARRTKCIKLVLGHWTVEANFQAPQVQFRLFVGFDLEKRTRKCGKLFSPAQRSERIPCQSILTVLVTEPASFDLQWIIQDGVFEVITLEADVA